MGDNVEDPTFAVIELFDQLEEIILDCFRIPFTGNRLVNEQDAIEVLDSIRELMPNEFVKVKQLLDERANFTRISKQQAEDILKKAIKQRDHVINTSGIRQEANKQIAEMKTKARQECDEMIRKARQKVLHIDNEINSRNMALEKEYAINNQRLEQQLTEKKAQYDQELTELKYNLAKQHEVISKQAMIEVEEIRKEGFRIKQEARNEAERQHLEAMNIRDKTQKKCESALQQARAEASSIQEGANQYADQTLGELELRLNEMTKVIKAGRFELSKIMTLHVKSKRQRNELKTIPFRRESLKPPMKDMG